MNEYRVYHENGDADATVQASSIFEAIITGSQKLSCDPRDICNVELVAQLTDIPF